MSFTYTPARAVTGADDTGRVARELRLDGCFNARDLGGLPIAGGDRTRFGSLVRSDAPTRLTAEGWSALYDYGVRTIIDLRNDDELSDDASPRPADVDTVHIALDGVDEEFWRAWGNGPRFCTPVYYRPHLERFPDLSARVLRTIARAPDGAVLFHCVGGRDRTGLISMLLLDLAGVAPDDIAADHAVSYEVLRRHHERMGRTRELRVIEQFLAEDGRTTEQMLVDTLAAIDVAALLQAAGLDDGDLAAVRDRLL